MCSSCSFHISQNDVQIFLLIHHVKKTVSDYLLLYNLYRALFNCHESFSWFPTFDDFSIILLGL